MITINLKTLERISEKEVTDNWWSVYLKAARMEGRSISRPNAYTLIISYNEKNKIIQFVRPH